MTKMILLLSASMFVAACTDPGREAANRTDRSEAVNRTDRSEAASAAAPSGQGSAPLKNALRYAETGEWLVEPKIVDGVPAVQGDDPWQVALVAAERTDGNFAFCGGSLVRANWVVTAAHCVDRGTQPSQVDVVSGTIDLNAGGTRSRVAQIIIHRDWDPNSHYDDIALLRLAGNASGTPIGLATTASETQQAAPGATVRVTGWGRTTQGGSSVTRLRTVDMPIVGRTDCNDRVAYDGAITDNMICAGRQQGEGDSCQGDSGGPLTSAAGGRALVGIVSWGEGCAQPNKYGVYTRVANYGAWVDNCIGGRDCLRQ